VPRSGKESLIVALDVPTVKSALDVVNILDNVSFFKVGLQLFLTGELPVLLEALRQKQLFVDLKVPGDIANTIGSVVDLCVSMGIKFLTLSESMPLSAINVAKFARDRTGSHDPKFLIVPFLSSLDGNDLKATTEKGDVGSVVINRARTALHAGCDGIVVSGQEISLCRKEFPSTIIVSPGIRPAGSSSDDHKRFTTPTEAIILGADYLVVGRPILSSNNPRQAAAAIISEIDLALQNRDTSTNRSSSSTKRHDLLMSPVHQ
jgi:orotidine-5'-phosphate decarboxylase